MYSGMSGLGTGFAAVLLTLDWGGDGIFRVIEFSDRPEWEMLESRLENGSSELSEVSESDSVSDSESAGVSG